MDHYIFVRKNNERSTIILKQLYLIKIIKLTCFKFEKQKEYRIKYRAKMRI